MSYKFMAMQMVNSRLKYEIWALEIHKTKWTIISPVYFQGNPAKVYTLNTMPSVDLFQDDVSINRMFTVAVLSKHFTTKEQKYHAFKAF